MPYGYRLDPAADIPGPDPAEAPIVAQIFTAYTDTRLGTRAIAAGLNQRGIRTKTGRPWSGYTIGRMLTNRVYLGEKVFGDITIPDAHPPLIDAGLFHRAQQLITVRGAPGSRCRAVSSDYDLTGLITCPACGRKYIGSAARGRSRSYRYYTCFSRVRYGGHGCHAPRLPADDLDQAVAAALSDLYANTDLITQAIAAERDHRASNHDTHTQELAGVTHQLAATEAAIGRYQTAFENDTLDPETFGHRVRDLTAKATQLRHRQHDLTEAVSSQPAPPSQHEIDTIRASLAHILRHGTPGQRKAAIEASIAEIKIENDQVIPIFKVPTGQAPPAPAQRQTVRAIAPTVGRAGLEPATEG
ncbi:MAG TPA: recombinase family protein, partial [Micromonosporaceae bacterium]|nr:recombinase family protein [Micromonosporaceae bacterium]